ncbi:MAG: AAA family ATPase [Gammaproteobacteria bacterium]|nr:AAA family ATPase [Gammaproteobacteria bacterium]
MEAATVFRNPFRPGAGHTPPYLAGRKEERREFLKLLNQDVILSNLILTGLRGVGKTVLLDTFKPLAVQKDWLWVGADLSESTTVDEERLATRILTDVALATSNFVYDKQEIRRPGFGHRSDPYDATLNYPTLRAVYERTDGLVSDRLKAALTFVWLALRASAKPPRGIVFAYDEAQNMADHAKKDEYPLSVMLDVFQSIQRQGAPFLLALTGLPTLFPKLVKARTYSERMFRVVFLNRLDPPDVREAIVKPIAEDGCPITFTEESIRQIEKHSGGYPYFIQFICHEAFDVFVSQITTGSNDPSVPIAEITAKLDSDFFAGRWSRVTDRQRDLLHVASRLDPESEFSVQEIVELSRQLPVKPFSSSHASQILAALINSGIIFKNRHGKYSFAVPLLGDFIRRQYPVESTEEQHALFD